MTTPRPAGAQPTPAAPAGSPGFWADGAVPVRTYRRQREDFLQETRRWLENLSLSTLSPDSAASRLLVQRDGVPARGQHPLIRIFGRCKVVGGCWEFQGSRTEGGYGKVRDSGRSRPAHRVVFTELNGPLPSDIYVCHTCDNPPCCNPAHLFAGTATDNNRDRQAKGRTRGAAARGRSRDAALRTRT